MISAILLGIFIFVMATVADVFWHNWTYHVNQLHPLRASFWAALIPLAGVWSIDGYLHSLWYVIPVMAGCAVGTFIPNQRKKIALARKSSERPLHDGEPVLPSRDA